jgi:dihydropteroate synthase
VRVRHLKINDKRSALEAIREVGADATGCAIMGPKAVHRVLKVYGLTPQQANIVKQEMLARGGEAAVARGVADGSVDRTDVLLMGTLRQFSGLTAKLRMQPFGLKALAGEIEKVLEVLEGRRVYDLDCRGKQLRLGERTLIMGILNVTPDSFSDGGRFLEPAAAVEHACRMAEEGADIIDVGGESTRPGHTPVPLDEELRRVVPVLERLVEAVHVPISIDTYKAEVARQALEIGVHMVNDQWALRADPEMAATVARYGAPVVLMHNRRDTEYRDLMHEILTFLSESVNIALEAGIPREKIIVDPGIGFGKTVEQNLEVLHRLSELRCLGQPILLGTSRKSVIGKTLDLPVDERVEGTAATVALGIAAGADIVRVHDVRQMVRVARMADAVVRRGTGWF